MTKLNSNIYSETVTVDPGLSETLKRCFINHIVICNYALELMAKDTELSCKALQKEVAAYVEENNISPVLKKPLYNEVYYQHKKYRNNITTPKRVTNVQYFTYITNGISEKEIAFDNVNNRLNITECEGFIYLEKPLPPLQEGVDIYVNLSYSAQKDSFRLTISIRK